ncbi:MAG TPA: 3-phenylpropionate/cinnamic acid dioxygenase subunit beta [Pseudonocardiaceae bacterium]|nr:3-phenylpropionate/cinnamic acid dioxygenase subunit beta [Pseudonocardiaceae bacterium]
MTELADSVHVDAVRQLEYFFYTEADLLDERRYEEWLDLLHEDVEYIVPLRRNVHSQDTGREFTQAGRDILWFDEGKETLRQRVEQLATGLHWAEEPVSRTSHLITNVRVTSRTGDRIESSCRFLIYRNRMETETDIFTGRRLDTVESVDGRWLLRKRVALLDQSVLLGKNLTFFL